VNHNARWRPTRPKAAVRLSRQKLTCMCKAYPIDCYPGGIQRLGAQCPHSNSRSIPCGGLDPSVLSGYHSFLGFGFTDDTRRRPIDYTVCGDCMLRYYASCQVPRRPTATRCMLQVQRWVLTCDAARRPSYWGGRKTVCLYTCVGEWVPQTGLMSI
jgi:hypothetical protein